MRLDQLHFFYFGFSGFARFSKKERERERERESEREFSLQDLISEKKISQYSVIILLTQALGDIINRDTYIYCSVVNFHLIIQINLLETPWTGIWNISKLHETMQPDSIHTNTKTKNQNSMRITKKSVGVAMLKDMNDYKSLIKPIYTNNICLDILIHCMQNL